MNQPSGVKVGTHEWLRVCGGVDGAFEQRLGDRLSRLYAADGQLSREVERVRDMALWSQRGGRVTSAHRLDLLRRLCQIYSVGIEERPIRSHRRVIGPVIVAAKRMVLSILGPLLGPSFKHQSEFNAVAVMLLHDICRDDEGRQTAGRAERLE